ncbi:MAG: zinc ABC transporter substrate-binding protein [Clostridia bacterium]|nr:zinc ABC transporter substrate-binding protein [Clostridia bacterium]
MSKKILATLLALLFLALPLSGCGKREDDGKLTVVCTIYPIYDWVKNIVGNTETVEVILLAQNGTDLHSYQPTAEDMTRIASCEVLIRIGGDSDAWVVDMLERTPSKTRQELILTETPGVTLREISAESVAQGHTHDQEHDHGADCEIDEHLWLSLKNAVACVEAISEQLCLSREEQAPSFRENAQAYTSSLTELDGRYTATVAQAVSPRLLFADRFPFIYMTEDYGIEYLAAFEGCSTESGATAATLVRLAQKADEWQLAYICVTETANRDLAEGVIAATAAKNQTVVELNSLQSVTDKQIESGITYLSVMEQNLTVLEQILLP